MVTNLFEVRRRCEAIVGKYTLFLLSRIVHRLPLRWALALGRGLGTLAARLSSRHFRRVCADIAQSVGTGMTPEAVERLAMHSYHRMGENVIEFFRLPYMTAEEICTWAQFDGAEHIEAARAQGKGVIMLTAHLGNWELCGTMMGLSPYPCSAIARSQNDSALTELFNRVREVHGLRVIEMTDVRSCIRALKANECLGILGDVNARVPGAFVQFFGRPAATYTGAAYLAQMTGAAVVPIFDERLPDLSHRIRVSAPIPLLETGDRQRDLLLNTIRIQQVIQQEIRRRPEDWYWLLSRWKTRPEDVAQPERIPMEHRDLTPEEAAEAFMCTDEPIGADRTAL